MACELHVPGKLGALLCVASWAVWDFGCLTQTQQNKNVTRLQARPQAVWAQCGFVNDEKFMIAEVSLSA